MNDNFVEAVPNLGIKKSVYVEEVDKRGVKTMEQKIDAILESYKSHPSIVMIKSKVKVSTKFKFKETTADEMYRKMILLNSKKATPEGDMSVDLLKCIADIIAGTVADIFNEFFLLLFLLSLKISETVPATISAMHLSKSTDISPSGIAFFEFNDIIFRYISSAVVSLNLNFVVTFTLLLIITMLGWDL